MDNALSNTSACLLPSCFNTRNSSEAILTIGRNNFTSVQYFNSSGH